LYGVDHVSVTVTDLERSLRFYRDLLGLRVLGQGAIDSATISAISGEPREPLAYADLDLGAGQILELLQLTAPPVPVPPAHSKSSRIGHFGLRVRELDAVVRRLREAGIRIPSEPVELHEPEWWEGARCVYVGDPDGTTVELVERRIPE
jgi:catechol 2,3-dioxygenase-like lactoylglutathione lyase family enzyme